MLKYPTVTRIARYISVMDNAEVTFMPKTKAFRYGVGLEHFVQGHMMREGPGNSIFMCYLGYDREIELPCPRLSLSLRGEKPNLADAEEGARTIKCCRTTNEEQDLARTTSRSRTITTDTPGSHYGVAQSFHTEYEFQGGILVLHLYRPELIPGRQ